uniref:Uncharacterized protein n=1 Tax=uncultured Caudovirales phage TaxID=2100421 RepID=A0A6J7WZD7_9CAUD|nr:hypothetical protein UFOVP385_37 [uncultured Caudovirales phage]
MGVTSTQGFSFKLVANGTELDLFADEDILVSDNVTGLFDIGVLPSDFTRQITVPGTKVNNAFFEHVYDISVINPYLFATNVKVPCYLDFDGIYLSNGYLQLNKVNILANKFIESYEITLYGGLSSFARDVNKKFLTDLTSLQKYNHTASYDNITASWSGNLFSGSIVYPLADYGSAYQFTQGQLQTFGINTVDGALSTQNFKPAIRAKAVLDAIFEDAGYTYTSSFLGSGVLDDVYLNCNYALKYPEFAGVELEGYGKIKVGAISGSTDTLLPSNTFVTLPFYNEFSDVQNFYQNGAYRVEKTTNLQGVLNLNLNVSCSVNNMPGTFSANGTFQLQMIETGSSTAYSLGALQSYIVFFDQLQNSRGSFGIDTTYELQTQFKLYGIPAGNYYFQVRQRPNFALPTVQPTVTMDPDKTTKSYIEITQVDQAADGRIMDIPANMPYGTNGIKQIDFILGLQKKFNLIIYPNKIRANEFVIETFNDWYKRGEVKDFNRYINLDKTISVTPANNLAVNKLNFGDTLDGDYISQQFVKGANREFGKSYYVDTTNFFSQGEFNVKTTFASDPLLRIPGTGLSGSVGGVNPTITQYSAGVYNFTNINNSTAACNSGTESIEIFTEDGNLTLGQIAYLDQYGENPVTGYYYFSNTLQVYRISVSTGEILGFSRLCPR